MHAAYVNPFVAQMACGVGEGGGGDGGEGGLGFGG